MNNQHFFELAKQGNAQAISELLNQSLESKGIKFKVWCSSGCLNIVAESSTAPQQEAVVSYLKNGITKLQPENISKVIVRGRVAGDTSPIWQDSFSLMTSDTTKLNVQSESSDLTVSPQHQRKTTQTITVSSKPKTTSNGLNSLFDLVKNRNVERGLIVTGTFLATSLLWLAIGVISSNNSSLTASDSSPTASDTDSPSLPSPLQVFQSYSLKGSFTLVDSDIGGGSSYCYGTGGYEDVRGGMPVTIRDANGSIVATGRTEEGTQPADEYASVMCVFKFQIDDIPKLDFYSIEVGRRGELNYSFEEMEQMNWEVDFSLG